VSEFQKRLLFYFASFGIWFALLFVLTGGLTGLPWIAGWHRWDSTWYVRIWKEGYTSDPKMMAFPPGYSWIIGPVSDLVGSFDLASLIVNSVAFLTAGILATEFICSRYAVSSTRFFIFFLSAPVAFYTFSVYSDAVFLLVFWTSLVVASKDPATMSPSEKWRAAVLLFFVPWIRLTGYALLIWTLFRRWFAFSVLATLTLWLSANAYFYGDPLHFLHIQQAFIMPKGSFLDGLSEACVSIFVINPYRFPRVDGHFWLQVAVFPVSSMILLFFTAGWFVRKKEFLIAATILAVMLFSRNQAFWRSVFRYDWPLMPLIAVPLLIEWDSARSSTHMRAWLQFLRRTAFWILTGVCFLIQFEFAMRMHLGYWTF